MDTAALLALLDASFRLWSTPSRAEADAGGGLAARIHPAGRKALRVARVQRGRRGLPAWRLGPLDAPPEAALEAPSLTALLKHLRMELDVDYVPGRVVVGLRPDVSAGGAVREHP